MVLWENCAGKCLCDKCSWSKEFCVRTACLKLHRGCAVLINSRIPLIWHPQDQTGAGLSDSPSTDLSWYTSFFLLPLYQGCKTNRRSKPSNRDCITTGIKTSCLHKRELCLISGNSHNPKLKMHYRSYCRILSNLLKAAENLCCNRKIVNSNNKMKTTWNILKSETGKKNQQYWCTSVKCRWAINY